MRLQIEDAIVAIIGIALLVAVVLLSGCTTTREIIQTRIDTLTVVTPTQYDTVTIHDTAAGYEGATVKYILRVDTLYKKVFITRRPDTVRVAYIDTVTVISAYEPEPWYVNIKPFILSLAALILAIGAVYQFVIRK